MKTKNTTPLKSSLSKNLVHNMNVLIEESGVNQAELAKLAGIPYSTLNGIVTGSSANPRLYTLSDLSRVFNVPISRLIGEMPLNFSETTVPILEWADLDKKYGTINFMVTPETKFISCSLNTTNTLFALRVGAWLSNKYKDNSIVIFEQTTSYVNNDLVILSINQSEPTVKKIIKEGEEIYLRSLSENIPPQAFNKTITKIYGIIRETRILN